MHRQKIPNLLKNMDDTQAYQTDYATVSNYAVSNNDSASSSAENETSTNLFSFPQTEEEMRYCKHCRYQAEDWPAFSKHAFTSSHLQKIAEAYRIRLSSDPVSNTFTCDICVVECQGHQSWVSHLLGTKHRKALEQISIAKAEEKSEIEKSTGGPIRNFQFGNMRQFGNNKPYDRTQRPSYVPSVAAQDFAQYPEPLIGLEYLTEIQVAGQNPRYECSLCYAKFDHNLKFPHLVGQKHRINVLKRKRPAAIKGVASKKRSEITSILIRESINLELEEGRQKVQTKVKQPSPNADSSQQNIASRTRGTRGLRGASQNASTWSSRGARRGGNVSRGNANYTSRGASNKRSVSQARGGYNGGWVESSEAYSNSYTGPGGTYNHNTFGDSYANESFGMNSPSYNSPGFVSPSYSGGYNQSVQGQTYSDNTPQYSGSGYPAPPPPKSPQLDSRESGSMPPKQGFEIPKKEGISTGLAGVLGDLSKLVQNEDDASVALHVSNALTQALLQYRMGNENKDEN